MNSKAHPISKAQAERKGESGGPNADAVAKGSRLSITLEGFRQYGGTNTSDILQAYREDQHMAADDELADDDADDDGVGPEFWENLRREVETWPRIERNADADLQELSDALDQEQIDEMNSELQGKFDPPPTPRWPRE